MADHGHNSALALSYNSRESQLARFEVLLQIIPDKQKKYTLLDVGCGLGDLSSFLDRQGYTNIGYTGLDIVPEMVAAAQKKFPKKNFLALDFQDSSFQLPFDLIVSSGALNIVYDKPEWQLTHIQKMIRKMFELSTIACGFNLLSRDTMHLFEQDDRFYYTDSRAIFSYCQKITPHSQKITGYLPHDFTILMRKM